MTKYSELAVTTGSRSHDFSFISISFIGLPQYKNLTAKFSGAANGIPRWMRDLLRGLRCNALLGRFPSSYGLPSLLYHRSSSGSLAAPRPTLSALAPCSLYPLLPLYLLVFSSLSLPLPLRL